MEPSSFLDPKYTINQKLKVAVSGLGPMGKRHAVNFLNRIPRAELVAAYSSDPAELAWAKENLQPHGVVLYNDYMHMIMLDGLMAVVITTANPFHTQQALQAMEFNLHVLCEKPLSANVAVVSDELPKPAALACTQFSYLAVANCIK
jgi:myo-inositol 2-dehydrogenase / D-chiro-inositol 1-dehydrogenase